MMRKAFLVSLIGGLVWGFSIRNGGDQGTKAVDGMGNPEIAADTPGDLICWWQPNTFTATSNIVETRVFQTATVRINLSRSTNIGRNDTFSADLVIEDVTSLDAVDICLSFDPKKLTVMTKPAPETGTIFAVPNVIFGIEINSRKGYIGINAARMGNSFTGTGTVVKNIMFKAMSGNPTTIINITTAKLVNLETGEIPCATYPGMVYGKVSHFDVWYPKDIIIGRPSTMTITAKDYENKPIITYVGRITIASKPIRVRAQISGFIAGVCIATITAPPPKQGTLTIEVSDRAIDMSTVTKVINARYLCDFGRAIDDTSPDGKIDIYDLILFVKYWRNKDLRGDVGEPIQKGSPPAILSNPDGKVDIWDLWIFVKMWRWIRGIRAVPETLTTPRLVLTPSKIEPEKDKVFIVNIGLENGSGIVGGKIELKYDPEVLDAVSVDNGGYFDEGFNVKINNGIIEIEGLRMIGNPKAQGIIAKIGFKPKTDNVDTTITIKQDSSFLLHEEVDDLIKCSANQIELGGPEYSALFQSVPNPAREGAWIPYQLAEGGDTKIIIYNILGQVVRKVDLGYKPKRYYKALREGSAAYWDLKNDMGQRVANGLYFYKLSSGRFSQTKALVITK